MKLSIIIPVYNVEKYVEKCLRSCAEQDLPSDEYEIIVVNDGTKDSSLEIVERVAKDYSNIAIISQENAGLSAARNKGLSIAKGDYIWFVDSDDWIEKNCLQKIIRKCFEDRLDVLGICAANVVNESYVRRFENKESKTISGKMLLLKHKPQVCVPFSIYRTEFLNKNKLNFYVGIFHEDSEFTPRAYYLAKKIAFINDIYYFVNQNPNSITRTFNTKRPFDTLKVNISLNKFYVDNVEKKYSSYFHYQISLNINNTLNYTRSEFITKEITKDINNELYLNKHLFEHLIKSNVFKYKFEGILFYLFPKNTIQIYNLIQIFNKK